MYTRFTSDAEVIAIGLGLKDRTLPKSRWTHSAHFAAALWLLSEHPEEDLLPVIRTLIREYNEATGGANTESSGYHETITQASLRAARHFLRERPESSLHKTCNALLASPLGKSDWLLAYWSRRRLFSAEARRRYVEPDLAAFPY